MILHVDYGEVGKIGVPTTALFDAPINIPNNDWYTSTIKAKDALIAILSGSNGALYIAFFSDGEKISSFDHTSYNVQCQVDSNGYIQFKLPGTYWSGVKCFIA